MSTEVGFLGLSNRWYREGIMNLWTATAKAQEIQIFSAPYYLPPNLINSRGKDYRTSHDIEDIINILDNCTSIFEAEENQLSIS